MLAKQWDLFEKLSGQKNSINGIFLGKYIKTVKSV